MAASGKLTPKQEAFIAAYLETGNASAAYRRAYNCENMKGATIKRAAVELLTHPTISARVRAAHEKVEAIAVEKSGLDKAWVLNNLERIADRCLQQTPVLDSEGNETGEFRFDSAGANRAVELVAKHLGMFVERREHGAPGEFKDGTPEAVRKRIAERIARLGSGHAPTRGLNGSRKPDIVH